MKKTVSLLALAFAFVPALSYAAKADGPKARAMAQFDADKDGKFSETELAAIRASFSEKPDGDLARFDADKDGKLSDAEIAQMIPGSGKKSGGKKAEDADAKKGAKKSDAKKSGGKKSDGEKKKSKKDSDS